MILVSDIQKHFGFIENKNIRRFGLPGQDFHWVHNHNLPPSLPPFLEVGHGVFVCDIRKEELQNE